MPVKRGLRFSMNKRIAFVVALLILPLITHCGSGSSDNASISSTTGQSNMAVGIQLPSGFTYDPATGAISGSFARARMGASNPKAYVGQAYITQIDVTRTGGTLASQTISLTGTPPPTSAEFTVTPGEAYNFSAAIYTNQPAPWNLLSGGTLSPVTAPADGQTVSVDINIPGVNGVPVVTFTADNMNPGAGTANLTCSSVDPDADPVTYLIKTVAPPAGANILSNTNPSPGSPIAYTTGIASQVDLECVATDSYGAIGYGKLSLNPGATTVTAPSAPTGVTATAGSGQVTISWSASTGATSYNLYWSTAPGVTTANNKIGGGSSPYVHAGLTNGAAYYYAVTAVNAVGESGLSAEVNATPTAVVTPPAAPTTILVAGGANSVGMTWSPVANATSYNLYWRTSPGVTTSNGTKIANVGTYNSTYNDYGYNHTGLTASTTYYYILTAVNAGGESAPSPEANATTTAALTAPSAPTGVTAVGASAQVTVSWGASAGATSYNLYWSATSPVTTGSTKITGVTSPYVHANLTNGIPYYYAVTAVNAVGESVLSAEVSATPLSPWAVKTTMPTLGYGATSSAVNGKIYVIGGQLAAGGGAVNTVEEYNPATDTWAAKTAMPTAREGTTNSVVNGKIYVFGGHVWPLCGFLTTVEEYDPATDTWAAKTPMPTGRMTATSSVVNGKIYVMGGNSVGCGGAINTVEEYDPATDTWAAKTAMSAARDGATSSVVNGKIYVFGGWPSLATVEEYDPVANTWAAKTPMPTGRYNPASDVVNGKIYVIGGSGLTAVEQYDPATNTWATKTAMPTALGDTLTSSMVNNKIYVFGSAAATSVVEVDEYNPALDP
jgi:N-acetylneuraminic acid mutarotase